MANTNALKGVNPQDWTGQKWRKHEQNKSEGLGFWTALSNDWFGSHGFLVDSLWIVSMWS